MSLVVDLPIAQLATTLAPLRGPRTDAASPLAPLPLRVTPAADGTYEVLDGFKRLARWRQDGHTHAPVVVEDAPGVVGKASLLEANAPRRTLSPMDEAHVVRALADDDHLTPPQITALLGRGRGWVDRRLVLGRRLAPDLARHVDDGRLSATTAHALASPPRGDQPRLAATLERHGLRTREAEAFLATWRAAADDPVTREALLRDPRRATPAPGDATVSPLGPTARDLQAWFAQTERALDALVHMDLTHARGPGHRHRVSQLQRPRRRAHPAARAPHRRPRARADPPHAPARSLFGALDDVDPGSPQDYTLDSMTPTGGPDDGA